MQPQVASENESNPADKDDSSSGSSSNNSSSSDGSSSGSGEESSYHTALEKDLKSEVEVQAIPQS